MADQQPTQTPHNPQPDPRLQGHETVYCASRGGYYPPPQTPVPGTPKP